LSCTESRSDVLKAGEAGLLLGEDMKLIVGEQRAELYKEQKRLDSD
jgi:hypothetical protein